MLNLVIALLSVIALIVLSRLQRSEQFKTLRSTVQLSAVLLDVAAAAALIISVYTIFLPWPTDADATRFAAWSSAIGSSRGETEQ